MTHNHSIILQCKQLSHQFQGQEVLKNISFELQEGKILTLIGPNGSGKSTLIRLLLGLLKPQQGQIYQRPKLRIGYMPQKLHVNPSLPLTVARFLTLNTQIKLAQQQNILELTEIQAILHKPLQKVSGGEMQRLLLARALLRRPNLLVLDEPAQGVDINGQQELYRIISQVRDEHACSVFMVSHDLHLVMAASDFVICLNHHICCTGHPESVSQHPEYLRLFGALDNSMALYNHHHDHQHDLHGNILPNSEPRSDG